MRLSPRERLGYQEALFDTREASRWCYLCIPVSVRADFDVDTQSGDDMSDGDGLGETVGQWRIYALKVHYRNVDNMLMAYGHVPPGVEIGDSLVNFGHRDLYSVKQAMANEESYLLIDAVPYHIVSMVSAGMGQIEEHCLDCRRFSPTFRAEGY